MFIRSYGNSRYCYFLCGRMMEKIQNKTVIFLKFVFESGNWWLGCFKANDLIAFTEEWFFLKPSIASEKKWGMWLEENLDSVFRGGDTSMELFLQLLLQSSGVQLEGHGAVCLLCSWTSSTVVSERNAVQDFRKRFCLIVFGWDSSCFVSVAAVSGRGCWISLTGQHRNAVFWFWEHWGLMDMPLVLQSPWNPTCFSVCAQGRVQPCSRTIISSDELVCWVGASNTVWLQLNLLYFVLA